MNMYMFYSYYSSNENRGLSKIVLPSQMTTQMTIGWNMIKLYISLDIFTPNGPYGVLVYARKI